ncbi:glycosyltransferase family 2 protein [Falsiroseomonas oryzae]|uniref:glycosyltransferase family 2 protein n=1 Tax=Falsiroseomonas oryzae TaxID=2766473 RepID=UPI0022EB080D|nr:glycosyltransferase family 2 protein [Roseomonas sp. MO-31]
MRVSVICPVLDTPPDLLEAAARSVLDPAANGAAEFILVDDGSTEPATQGAIGRLEGWPGVTLVRHPTRRGVAAARNSGIARAAGDWIGFVDSDDAWMPGWLETARGVLARHPDAGWIGGRFQESFPDGRLVPFRPLREVLPPAEVFADGVERYDSLALARSKLVTTTVMVWTTLVRRDLVLAAGGFDERLAFKEDLLFMLRLGRLAELHHVDVLNYLYRRGDAYDVHIRRQVTPANVAIYPIAGRDPLLRPLRREIRWAHYANAKGTALLNLVHGDRWTALRMALRAWAIDPREVLDLARFARLACLPPERVWRESRGYSGWMIPPPVPRAQLDQIMAMPPLT